MTSDQLVLRQNRSPSSLLVPYLLRCLRAQGLETVYPLGTKALEQLPLYAVEMGCIETVTEWTYCRRYRDGFKRRHSYSFQLLTGIAELVSLSQFLQKEPYLLRFLAPLVYPYSCNWPFQNDLESSEYRRPDKGKSSYSPCP